MENLFTLLYKPATWKIEIKLNVVTSKAILYCYYLDGGDNVLHNILNSIYASHLWILSKFSPPEKSFRWHFIVKIIQWVYNIVPTSKTVSADDPCRRKQWQTNENENSDDRSDNIKLDIVIVCSRTTENAERTARLSRANRTVQKTQAVALGDHRPPPEDHVLKSTGRRRFRTSTAVRYTTFDNNPFGVKKKSDKNNVIYGKT